MKKEKKPLAQSWDERRMILMNKQKEKDVKKTKRAAKRDLKAGKIKTITTFFPKTGHAHVNKTRVGKQTK